MQVTITGHRSEKLVDEEQVVSFLKDTFKEYGVTKINCGMANGVDLIGGTVALSVGIPLVAVKPWNTHGPRRGDEEAYSNIINNAESVINVVDSDTYPGPWAYQKRNEWMADHCDMVVAVWDGSSGGTKNCTDYAIKHCINIVRFNPRDKSTNVIEWGN